MQATPSCGSGQVVIWRVLCFASLVMLTASGYTGTTKAPVLRPVYKLNPVSADRKENCDMWSQMLLALQREQHVSNMDFDGLPADCAEYFSLKNTKCPEDHTRLCESIYLTPRVIPPRTLEVTVENLVTVGRVSKHGNISNEKLTCEWRKDETRSTCEAFIGHMVASALKIHNDTWHSGPAGEGQ